MATKMSPAAMLRLSIETPPMGLATSPSSRPPVAATSSSIVHSGAVMPAPADGGLDGLVIGIGHDVVADDLARLMALAGHQQDIAVLEPLDGPGDRLAPASDLDAARTGGHDGGADGGRVLAARIVVGDVDHVGQFGGDRAHLRPLAAIAVAAAAEDHHKPPGACGRSAWSACLRASGVWA
jgi:hypothetical protein